MAKDLFQKGLHYKWKVDMFLVDWPKHTITLLLLVLVPVTSPTKNSKLIFTNSRNFLRDKPQFGSQLFIRDLFTRQWLLAMQCASWLYVIMPSFPPLFQNEWLLFLILLSYIYIYIYWTWVFPSKSLQKTICIQGPFLQLQKSHQKYPHWSNTHREHIMVRPIMHYPIHLCTGLLVANWWNGLRKKTSEMPCFFAEKCRFF